MSTTADREDRVLERIDKFRQRRPRLLDDVVTLAHGAGGKASAALVDAVFLEAFRNDELEQLGDAAALLTPSGERLAFSTDCMSFRRGAFRADPLAMSPSTERSMTSRYRARVRNGCRRRSSSRRASRSPSSAKSSRT